MFGFLNTLSNCQEFALKTLNESKQNVFLTGGAGTGKSYVVSEYLKQYDRAECPIVASTGAAAILVGGRTFHSFFGIGILEGGIVETVNRAVEKYPVKKRLKQCQTVVIDEISMIPGQALLAAEWICRKVRGNSSPWGGIRIIAVGDFFQLPPVTRAAGPKDWAFLSETWNQSEFLSVSLKEVKRSDDPELTQALGQIRVGDVNRKVTSYFEKKVSFDDGDFKGTRLFPRRDTVDAFNEKRLLELPGETQVFETTYWSVDSKNLERIQKDAPLPVFLRLKKGALVMLRNNDLEGQWVNGSLGIIEEIAESTLGIGLLSGSSVRVSRVKFEQLDADGKVIGSAENFPVNLAYATTIHKAQGMTLDQVRIDLSRAWEHGQAYVALSRAKSGKGIFLSGWSERSIVLDPQVRDFHKEMGA